MTVSYDPPQSLLALTLELKESSEKRAKINLFRVLSKLLGTIFFQEAPALATLRNALGDVYKPLLPDGLENHELLDKFFRIFTCVPFTTNRLLPACWTDNYLDSQMSTTCSPQVSLPTLPALLEQVAAGLNTFSNIPILFTWAHDGTARTCLGLSAAGLHSFTSIVGKKLLMTMITSSKTFRSPFHQAVASGILWE